MYMLRASMRAVLSPMKSASATPLKLLAMAQESRGSEPNFLIIIVISRHFCFWNEGPFARQGLVLKVSYLLSC
ncbi:hypothetical protein GCM10009504_12380 [Pseudomonas laurentiana]|nr:hypothetical protein GCM10009504_12380 [Pseudomonas laurentiana]